MTRSSAKSWDCGQLHQPADERTASQLVVFEFGFPRDGRRPRKPMIGTANHDRYSSAKETRMGPFELVPCGQRLQDLMTLGRKLAPHGHIDGVWKEWRVSLLKRSRTES